jgi:subtilisin family serine protease
VAADGVSTFIAGPAGFSGTSASAPAVAGAAALYLSARPGYPPARVRAFLTGRAQGGNPGNTSVGYGRVFLGDLPAAASFPLIPNRSPIGSRQ